MGKVINLDEARAARGRPHAIVIEQEAEAERFVSLRAQLETIEILRRGVSRGFLRVGPMAEREGN